MVEHVGVGFTEHGSKAIHIESLEGDVWSVPIGAVLTTQLGRERPTLGKGIAILFTGTNTSKAGRSYHTFVAKAEEHIDVSTFDEWFEIAQGQTIKRDTEAF